MNNIKKLEKNVSNILKKYCWVIILTIILSLSFCINFFNMNDNIVSSGWTTYFQKDSEALVISKIYIDRYNVGNDPYGLCNVKQGKNVLFQNKTYSVENLDTNDIVFIKYHSQLGLQGYFFSFLYNQLGIHNISYLRLFTAVTLAIVLSCICYEIYLKYGKLMSICFGTCFALSPWVIACSQNLYWVEFTWFMPFLMVMIYDRVGKKKDFIFLPLIACTTLVKSLCGYEYISSIMLLAISLLVVDFFKSKDNRKEQFIKIVKVSLALFLGFAIAITIHAYLRGNGNIFNGYKVIYVEDVTRRLGGGSLTDFGPIIEKSLKASYLSVICTYLTFSTPVLIGFLSRETFPIIVLLALLIILYDLLKHKNNSKEHFWLFFIMFLVPLSWYILAKPHSYIHTHMNYVLWYLGFLPICLFLIIDFLKRELLSSKNIEENVKKIKIGKKK